MKKLLIIAILFTVPACAGMTQRDIDSLAAGINQGTYNFQANYRPPVTCYRIGYVTQCY